MDEHGAEMESNVSDLSQGILFFVMLILGGGTVALTFMRRIPLPYTVVMFVYGIIMGAIVHVVSPEISEVLGNFPPELLFLIFLPVLIFEGSYGMNIHALRIVIWQDIILATAGIIINTGLLALPIKWFFPEWTWYSALLLGSLLSATDPVAVVSLLKGLGVDKRITAMVDGEALLNDATAIIAFKLLLPAAKEGRMSDSVGIMILKAFQLAGTPILLGPAFGVVQWLWLLHAPKGLCQACITVSVTYISYYVADHLIGTSGVLTMFFEGVFLSALCPTLFPGREGNVIHEIWEFLVHLGNTVLFSLVGVILVAVVWPSLTGYDVVVIFCVYIFMLLARLIMLEVLYPLLNLFSFKLTQREVLLLVHAGLRGGVAATLALAVVQEGLEEGREFLKITCGVVLLTLFINATTASMVVSVLGHKKKEKNRLVEMKFGFDFVQEVAQKSSVRNRANVAYQHAVWGKLEGFIVTHYKNPLAEMKCEEESPAVVSNKLIMRAFKACLWKLRDRDVISETVARCLASAVAKCTEKGSLLTMREVFCGVTQVEASVRTTGDTPPSVSSPYGEGSDPLVSIAAYDETQNPLEHDTLEEYMLPFWVAWSERVLGRGFWAAQHQRAQQNVFMALLVFSHCLEEVEAIKFQYTTSERHARVIEEWFEREHRAVKRAIERCQFWYPLAVSAVATMGATENIVDSMIEGVNDLRANHGFGLKTTLALEEVLVEMRNDIPRHWGDPPDEDALCREALATSTLCVGVSAEQIDAVFPLGIRRQYVEGDVIDTDGTFHVVVYGQVELQGHRLSAPPVTGDIGFGSIIAIESIVTPQSVQRTAPKRWVVRSSKCQTLCLAFSSVQPFLMEWSVEAVKCFWRSVAAEALINDLDNILTLPPNLQSRQSLVSIILDGHPVIGGSQCAEFDWSRKSFLCFYLRGNDKSGLFRTGSTPPTYISSFFAGSLTWDDPSVVLYAIPVTMKDDGYTPWRTPVVQGNLTSREQRKPDGRDSQHGASDTYVEMEPRAGSCTAAHEDSNSLEHAAELLCAVMTGRIGLADSPCAFTVATQDGWGYTPTAANQRGGRQRWKRISPVAPFSPMWHSWSLGPEIRARGMRSQWSQPELLSSTSLGHDAELEPKQSRVDWSNWSFILRSPQKMVTCVPYVNVLLIRYASVLEQLCLAALRLWRFPEDSANQRHAAHIADVALDFLLSFCTDLFIIRRVLRCCNVKRGAVREDLGAPHGSCEDTRIPCSNSEELLSVSPVHTRATEAKGASDGVAEADAAPSVTLPQGHAGSPATDAAPRVQAKPDGDDDDEDDDDAAQEAAFACRVSTLRQNAGNSRGFELKAMLMAMRNLADSRFYNLGKSLELAAQVRPSLRSVESISELEAVCYTG